MSISGFERPATRANSRAVPVLDASQRGVVEIADGASAAVIGAPGTGKSTTLIEVVADRVRNRGWRPEQVLALTLSRTTAARLRDAIALRLEVPTAGSMARTVNSLAFEVVRDAARATGAPAPRLVTGAEQDADIASLLQGHIDEATGPSWPDVLAPEVRGLRHFRTELRELMMRATEYGIPPDQLRELGLANDRPEWVASADFIDEYLAVVSTARETQLDPAELARFAVAAIGSANPGETVAGLRLVVVDDIQEATESTIAVLRALAKRGIAIIAFGDPDVAVNAFRGGEPDYLGRLSSVLGVPAQMLILSTSHRQGAALRTLTAAVTARIGASAAGRQREAVAGGGDVENPIAMIAATSPGREWAAIARELRTRHLEGGIAWRDMAVVVRSGAQIPVLARSLAHAEVPTRTAVGGRALRDDQAVRALLTLVDVGVGRSPLTAEVAIELLLSAFGGLDRLGLRRLCLALRAEELAGGGTRSADDLLVDALGAPGRLVTIDTQVARIAEKLAHTFAALRESEGTIEELLWIGWERSGLAKPWREQALGTGVTADEANRNLDGIVALFTAAKRFVERRPDASAETFLAEVLDADVPEDTLSPQSGDDAVLVTTSSGVVGLEFDTVVIAALQEGTWPNLRLRGSLLAPQQLVRVVTGLESTTIDERRQVLGDELRMFALAVSRARRHLVISAVLSEEYAGSPFLGFVPHDARQIDASRVVPLSLRGLVGQLRREAVAGDADSVSSLAALAAESVPGAEPDQWHGLLPISSTAPLFEGQRVPVSPSMLEKLVDSPLDWFLDKMAGSDSGLHAKVGTIVHAAMETAADSSVKAIWQVIESRWNELLFDAPWLAESQRRIVRRFAEAISEYLGEFERDGKNLVGAESHFLLEVGNADLRGTIDRVERSVEGSVVIVDLKTGSPLTSQSKIDEHPQLGAYQLAYAEGLLDEALESLGEHHGEGAKLLYVKKGVRGRKYREGIQAQFTEEQLESFRDRVRSAALLIAAAEFSGKAELADRGLGDQSRLRLHRVPAVSSD